MREIPFIRSVIVLVFTLGSMRPARDMLSHHLPGQIFQLQFFQGLLDLHIAEHGRGGTAILGREYRSTGRLGPEWLGSVWDQGLSTILYIHVEVGVALLQCAQHLDLVSHSLSLTHKAVWTAWMGVPGSDGFPSQAGYPEA